MALPAIKPRLQADAEWARSSEPAAARIASTAMVLAGIVLAALLLRLFKVTTVALWFDEFSSLAHSRFAWSELPSRIAVGEMHPPLYFAVLKVWCGLFGESMFAFRSLSIVFSVIAVEAAYLFVREAFRDRRAALTAALLLAVNPFQIQYAREGRMYAMGVCLVLVSSWLLARALRTDRWTVWIAYAVSAAACLYTHYYLAFAIAAHAVVAAAISIRRARAEGIRAFERPLLAYALAASLFAPWMSSFIHQVRDVQQDFWIPPLDAERLLRLSWTLVLGGSDSEWVPLPWLVVMTVVLTTVLVAAMRHARSWPMWLVILQIVVPIGAGLALSIHRSIFIDRYFVFVSAFCSVLVGILIAQGTAHRVRRAAVACVVLVSLLAFAKNLHAIDLLHRIPVDRPGMRGAAGFVNTHAQAGDAIVVGHSLVFLTFTYYNATPIAPTLYSPVPPEKIPSYDGGPLLVRRDAIADLHAIGGPRRVWYLWTDGFYRHKPAEPDAWRLESTHRFEDTPGFKGAIHVDEYRVPATAAAP